MHSIGRMAVGVVKEIKMQFKNYTEHNISVMNASGEVVVIPSSGNARVATTQGKKLEVPSDFNLYSNTSFGEVEGLPPPEEGVIIIASMLVAQKIGASRSDIFSPGTGPKDEPHREGGVIKYVTRLVRSY